MKNNLSELSEKNLQEILYSLTEGERKLLKYFELSKKKEAYEDEIADKLKLSLSEVSRSALWLENKNIAHRIQEKSKMITISEKGLKYVNSQLPEQVLLDYLKRSRSIFLKELPKKILLDVNEINAALGHLVRNGLIKIHKDKGEIEVTDKAYTINVLPSVRKFKQIAEKKTIPYEAMIDHEIKNLLRRGLVKIIEMVRWKIALTTLGMKLIERGIPEIEFIERITPEIISKRAWQYRHFRWYDVSSPVPKLWGGRKHPRKVIMEKIRRIFLEMGFREMSGPWVELAFWNMDGMWIPQDHPAREMQATFYLSQPLHGYVKDRELVQLVRAVQENGGDTGSLGWRQYWDEKEAMKTLLRTHTTAVTFRVLGFALRNNVIKPPVKFFAIGRVFRNETIDWKHLAEFHQVEGFVIAEGLTLRSLMGYIEEFYKKMGIKRLRFKPTYNPYTEPSMEVFAWHQKLKKWVEVGNSGLFRPETLRPYNIKLPVIAWGLAVERLAMLLYGIEDIRQVFGSLCDLDWLRWYKLPTYKIFEEEENHASS